jgi:uncharacterized protein (DUF433 family)
MPALFLVKGSRVYRLKESKYREDVDPRELAIYTPADVARFLGIHPATLGHWIYGRKNKNSYFHPVIEPADPENKLLSFYNLAEAHVLASTRYQHHVSFKAIRAALDTLQQRYPSKHPLISKDFFTNGKDIFIKQLDQNENLSTRNQTNFKTIMDMFLAHVGRDKKKLADRIYPVIKGQTQDKVITIIHGVASGQPVIDGRAVPVFVVYGRHQAGESAKSIAQDFGIAESKVKRAIEYVEKRDKVEKRAA